MNKKKLDERETFVLARKGDNFYWCDTPRQFKMAKKYFNL